MTPPPERLRVDKWLWVARFFRTRTLATAEVERGRVRVNGAEVKPSRELRPGDEVAVRIGPTIRTVQVRALSERRGGATEAALLYQETAQSVAIREAAAELRRLSPAPDNGMRPTKRDRRDTERVRGWGTRWSASIDDE